MKKSLFFLVLATAVAVFSCKKDDDTCNTTGVTYTNTIKAIFDDNCTTSGCHNAGSLNGELTDYLKSVAFSAAAPLVNAVKHEGTASKMPKGGTKLSDCDISKIEAWVKAGYPQ